MICLCLLLSLQVMPICLITSLQECYLYSKIKKTIIHICPAIPILSNNIGIIHLFEGVNICGRPLNAFPPERVARGWKHIWRASADVHARGKVYFRYYCIKRYKDIIRDDMSQCFEKSLYCMERWWRLRQSDAEIFIRVISQNGNAVVYYAASLATGLASPHQILFCKIFI